MKGRENFNFNFGICDDKEYIFTICYHRKVLILDCKTGEEWKYPYHQNFIPNEWILISNPKILLMKSYDQMRRRHDFDFSRYSKSGLPLIKAPKLGMKEIREDVFAE